MPYRHAVSGDPAVLRDRRLHDQQHELRRHADGVRSASSVSLFMKLECEPAPLLLGFVLGPMMEENLRRALLLSRGDPTCSSRGRSPPVLLIAAVLLILLIVLPNIRKTREDAFQEET